MGERFAVWRFAYTFPRASLTENCLLLKSNDVRGQICPAYFCPKFGAVHIDSELVLPDTRQLRVRTH